MKLVFIFKHSNYMNILMLTAHNYKP